MQRAFDLIVYGASGFTGQRICQNLLSSVLKQKPDLKWAVAGRNVNRIKESLKNAAIGAETSVDSVLNSVPIITASNDDPETLKQMSSQAKLVVNCVGPFRFYGEPVVTACIETKTHYIDITGEPEFQERIQLKYHKEAEKANIYIIPSAGFDCIPTDLGVKYLQKNVTDTFDSIDIWFHDQGGLTFNDATWVTFIESISSVDSLIEVRRKLYREIFGEAYSAMTSARGANKSSGNRGKKNLFYHTDTHGSGYALIFGGADHSVIRRTQLHDFILNGKGTFPDVNVYQVMSLTQALSWIGFFSVIKLIGTTEGRREFLKRHPRIFSAGIFSSTGPSEQELATGKFNILIQGKVDGDIKGQVKISGPHPGYIGCAICTNQAAITLLEELEYLPGSGGVFTPGTAFNNTKLIERLNSNNVKYQLITHQSNI